MQKLAVFHFISRHSLNINVICIFFYELLMSLRFQSLRLSWITLRGAIYLSFGLPAKKRNRCVQVLTLLLIILVDLYPLIIVI